VPEPHIDTSRPGELVGMDCFFVGPLHGSSGPVRGSGQPEGPRSEHTVVVTDTRHCRVERIWRSFRVGAPASLVAALDEQHGRR
jgi:hypothetical protein